MGFTNKYSFLHKGLAYILLNLFLDTSVAITNAIFSNIKFSKIMLLVYNNLSVVFILITVLDSSG